MLNRIMERDWLIVTDEEVGRARQQILKARALAATDTTRLAISLSKSPEKAQPTPAE